MRRCILLMAVDELVAEDRTEYRLVQHDVVCELSLGRLSVTVDKKTVKGKTSRLLFDIERADNMVAMYNGSFWVLKDINEYEDLYEFLFKLA